MRFEIKTREIFLQPLAYSLASPIDTLTSSWSFWSFPHARPKCTGDAILVGGQKSESHEELTVNIGIISDTHDRMDTLKEALRRFADAQVEKVIHAGDYVAPFVAKAFKGQPFSLLGVYGNNDGEKVGLAKTFGESGSVVVEGRGEWELSGKRILVMHEPRDLEYLATQKKHDIMVYGHTHRVDIRQGPPLIINPGEACGWVEGRASCAVLNLESMEVTLLELGTR